MQFACEHPRLQAMLEYSDQELFRVGGNIFKNNGRKISCGFLTPPFCLLSTRLLSCGWFYTGDQCYQDLMQLQAEREMPWKYVVNAMRLRDELNEALWTSKDIDILSSKLIPQEQCGMFS